MMKRTNIKKKQPFLYDYQYDAVDKMKNGCILNGGVGSGKSRTSLYYYFKECGGSIKDDYVKMTKPKDLYIITTAMKRDSFEWDSELSLFRLAQDELNMYKNKVKVDSWNNIKKYKDIKNAFFIFDEDRVTGYGVWTKSFLQIAKNNQWIILSATPGDTWSDYIPVFIANGYYKNKSEFSGEHIVYSRFTKFPKIDRYINTGRLIRLRNNILIDMDFDRKMVAHHVDVRVDWDVKKYKKALKDRWDPFKDEPIMQAASLCYVLRRIVNENDNRIVSLMEIIEKTPKSIIFYNFDYELNMLRKVFECYKDISIAEWNGHKHEPIPQTDKWVYLVQYTAGCEGWNCIKTNTIIFFSQNYSFKVLKQACGRIDRLNSPFKDLYYYHLVTNSGIDIAIKRALNQKKKFNEKKFVGGF